MPENRPQLRITKTEAKIPEGKRWNSEKYSVYLTINRPLTSYEREWINRGGGPRPLGIGGANPNTLPTTLLAYDTTIEQVAAARDDIKAFLILVESEGRQAEQAAQDKAGQEASAASAEARRRQEIADSIDWN